MDSVPHHGQLWLILCWSPQPPGQGHPPLGTVPTKCAGSLRLWLRLPAEYLSSPPHPRVQTGEGILTSHTQAQCGFSTFRVTVGK